MKHFLLGFALMLSACAHTPEPRYHGYQKIGKLWYCFGPLSVVGEPYMPPDPCAVPACEMRVPPLECIGGGR